MDLWGTVKSLNFSVIFFKFSLLDLAFGFGFGLTLAFGLSSHSVSLCELMKLDLYV